MSPLVLVVNPQLPVKSVQELIALARSQPGLLNCSSSGTVLRFILANCFLRMPRKLSSFTSRIPARLRQRRVTGETQVHFESLTAVLELVRNGNLRGLAVTGLKRSAALPDLPTVAEAGVPDFEMVIWNALFSPRNTPSEIVSKLSVEMHRLLEAPDIREAFLGLSMDISPMTREQLGTMVATEWTRMGRVVAASGAKID
jgi:tripartite-type tricarboxylate transporter receptor subunit TctC